MNDLNDFNDILASRFHSSSANGQVYTIYLNHRLIVHLFVSILLQIFTSLRIIQLKRSIIIYRNISYSKYLFTIVFIIIVFDWGEEKAQIICSMAKILQFVLSVFMQILYRIVVAKLINYYFFNSKNDYFVSIFIIHKIILIIYDSECESIIIHHFTHQHQHHYHHYHHHLIIMYFYLISPVSF